MKRGRASKKIENSRKDFTSEVASSANLAHASTLKTFARALNLKKIFITQI